MLLCLSLLQPLYKYKCTGPGSVHCPGTPYTESSMNPGTQQITWKDRKRAIIMKNDRKSILCEFSFSVSDVLDIADGADDVEGDEDV